MHAKQTYSTKGPFYRRICLRTGHLCAAIIALSMLAALPVYADSSTADKTPSSAWSSPIRFFQKYISRADGDRCPMHPSCSHYAAEAIERHGAVKGWILTCDRLLRCGHDEMRLAPRIGVKGRPRAYDPVKANTRWWSAP